MSARLPAVAPVHTVRTCRFGPYISLMYGREELLTKRTDSNPHGLFARKVRPGSDELPTMDTYELSRWEKGTLNFESIAGQAAAIE